MIGMYLVCVIFVHAKERVEIPVVIILIQRVIYLRDQLLSSLRGLGVKLGVEDTNIEDLCIVSVPDFARIQNLELDSV